MVQSGHCFMEALTRVRQGGRCTTTDLPTALLHPHRRAGLLNSLLLRLLLLLLCLASLLLELLHGLRPLRTTLLHRGIHGLQCADIAHLVEKVIASARRALRAPDRAGVLIQGDLVDALQSICPRLNRQSGSELVATLIRRTAMLLVQLVNEVARPEIERIIRVGRIVQARRALPKLSVRARLSLSMRDSLILDGLQCVLAGNAIDMQAMIALECFNSELCRRTKILVGHEGTPLWPGIAELGKLGLKVGHGFAFRASSQQAVMSGVLLRDKRRIYHTQLYERAVQAKVSVCHRSLILAGVFGGINESRNISPSNGLAELQRAAGHMYGTPLEICKHGIVWSPTPDAVNAKLIIVVRERELKLVTGSDSISNCGFRLA